MSRTVIDLDDELVAEVSRALGTRTKKDTVNMALREVLDGRRRALAGSAAWPYCGPALAGWPCTSGRSAVPGKPRGELTARSQHRSAGPVDLVIAATDELHGPTLLHHDRDFEVIARVTGQPLHWYGPD